MQTGAQLRDNGTVVTLGGADPNMAIGALTEVYGVTLTDGQQSQLTLDPTDSDHVSSYWANGITLNNTNNGFVFGTKGRYVISGDFLLPKHATLWTSGDLTLHLAGTQTSNSITRTLTIPPQTLAGSSLSTFAFMETIEVDVGAEIDFLLMVIGADSSLSDSTLTVQYIGPAVSL